MENAIATENLVKKFGSFEALTEIDLSVPVGTVLGLVGPNGAGKSTLMRILLGLYRKTSGEASVLGYDVQTQSHIIRSLAGYVPDKLPFSRDTVLDLVAGFAYLNGFSRRESKMRARAVLETFDASEYRSKNYRNLSDGMKKRVIIALASVHSPAIYFLDEPTSNLDVTGIRTVISVVRHQAAHGHSMLIASHKAKFIQNTCNHIGILLHGRLAFLGGINEFIATMQGGGILVPNRSLDDVELRPELVETLELKSLREHTLVPAQHWDDFCRIVKMDVQHLKAKPEPSSLSYALAKCYALGLPKN